MLRFDREWETKLAKARGLYKEPRYVSDEELSLHCQLSPMANPERIRWWLEQRYPYDLAPSTPEQEEICRKLEVLHRKRYEEKREQES